MQSPEDDDTINSEGRGIIAAIVLGNSLRLIKFKAKDCTYAQS